MSNNSGMEEKKSIIIRDEKGRISKGSSANPYGRKGPSMWDSFRKKMGEDLDTIYSEAIRLIKFSDSEKIKATMILGLLGLAKPKVETSNEQFNTLSHASMHALYETIVRQEEELRALRNQNNISLSNKND